MIAAPVALVPAAGRSARMGRPKLVLEVGPLSVIERVVRSLVLGGAGPVLVVAPPPTENGSITLADLARGEGAEVVHCERPTPDMRATVEQGLDLLAKRTPPPTGVLLCPADLPGITPEVVRRVVAQFATDPSRIVVPVHAGRRGHPIAIPWSLALAVRILPPGKGVNELLRTAPHLIANLEVPDPDTFDDLDTPEEYQRWLARPPAPPGD